MGKWPPCLDSQSPARCMANWPKVQVLLAGVPRLSCKHCYLNRQRQSGRSRFPWEEVKGRGQWGGACPDCLVWIQSVMFIYLFIFWDPLRTLCLFHHCLGLWRKHSEFIILWMFTWCHSDLVTFHLAAPHDLFIGPVLNIYFVWYFRETIRDMGIWVEKVMEINLKGKQTQGILGFIM